MPQEDEAGHPNFGYTERFKGIDYGNPAGLGNKPPECFRRS